MMTMEDSYCKGCQGELRNEKERKKKRKSEDELVQNVWRCKENKHTDVAVTKRWPMLMRTRDHGRVKKKKDLLHQLDATRKTERWADPDRTPVQEEKYLRER